MSRRINRANTTSIFALLSGFMILTTVLLAFTVLILEGARPEPSNSSPGDTSQLFLSFASIFTLVIALAITTLTFRERLRFSRVSPVTIALAGAPRAGKTVFANVVYQLLMEGYGPNRLTFTAETKSAQAVLHTIRGISEGRWPKATMTGDVFEYKGKLESPKDSLITRLVKGKSAIDLRIGDSAGETWLEVAEEYRREGVPNLLESSFLTYITESDGIFYFIDAESVNGNAGAVKNSVDDVISCVNLLRATCTGTSRQFTFPIGLILSKADFFSDAEIQVLRQLMLGDKEFSVEASISSQGVGKEFIKSVGQLERVAHVMQRITPNFNFFLVSALDSALTARIMSREGLSSIDSTGSNLGIAHAEDPLHPLYWMLSRTT